jgi:hypothetical protein
LLAQKVLSVRSRKIAEPHHGLSLPL